MITVGIRNLKSRLLQYLTLVKQGETVIITEHNRTMAEMRGINSEDDNVYEKYMDDLEKAGKLKKAKRNQSLIDSIVAQLEGESYPVCQSHIDIKH